MIESSSDGGGEMVGPGGKSAESVEIARSSVWPPPTLV